MAEYRYITDDEAITAMMNLVYQRFYDIDFDYDMLTEDEKAWCNDNEFTAICRVINIYRTKVQS